MKTLKLVIIGILLFLAGPVSSQVSVNVNIGSPPLWGPVGYTEVEYYYLPDVEAYYDVQSAMFIYYDGGIWIHRTYLPKRYRAYDLYGGYKVVMSDYHGNEPYTYFKEHKIKYSKGYHGQSQKTIGERPGKSKSNSNGHSKKINSQSDGNSIGHGSDKHESQGNYRNRKMDHGHGGGKKK